MSPTPSQAAHMLTLIEAEIERFVQRRLPKLRFEPSIEKLFWKYHASKRAELQFWLGVFMLVSFDGFLLGDWFSIRNHFATAIAIRAGVVTPIAIVLLYVVRANLNRWSRELAICTLALMGCFATLFLAFHDHRTFALQAEPTVFIILVVLCGLFRVEFEYCVVTTLLCVAANSVCLMALTGIPIVERVATTLPVIAAAMMLLAATGFPGESCGSPICCSCGVNSRAICCGKPTLSYARYRNVMS